MSEITPLFLTDEQIAERLGVSKQTWRNNVHLLERAGMPQRDHLFAHKRYWPAIEAFLRDRYGLTTGRGPLAPDGEENFG